MYSGGAVPRYGIGFPIAAAVVYVAVVAAALFSSVARSKNLEGQRGFVSLLFADLCDYTSLAEQLDPEDTRVLRAAVEQLALQCVEKYHGMITQVYGDGFLAVFGLSVPDEDHPRHAVEAALELHRAVRELPDRALVRGGLALRMHSGIHSGLVLAQQGDSLHGRYDLIGDSVNTAARLSAAAERDEILVSDATLCGIEAFFGVETLEPIALKGKTAPLLAHRVLHRTRVSTRFEARAQTGLTRLVGRADELGRMEQATLQLLKGESNALLLLGPAGAGKTRLLEEHRKRRHGSSVRVYRGCCERFGHAQPLQPFVQVLRQMFDLAHNMPNEAAVRCVVNNLATLDIEARETREALLHVLSLARWPDAKDAAAAKHSIVQALLRLFGQLCARMPVVLQLDDWQWADELSQALLTKLLRRDGLQPLLVIMAMRSEEGEPLPFVMEQLRLAPFSELESQTVVRSLRPDAVASEEIALIHRKSGGNPLFVEELCRALPRGASLTGDDALERLGIPTTIRGVIQARVAQLPADEAELLRVASVVGEEFSSTLLEEVTGWQNVVVLLRSLAGSDLIHPSEPGSGWHFKHGIARDVVYEFVRASQRRETHRAVAESLAAAMQAGRAPDAPEVLAHHYRGANDFAVAAHYASRAGDIALSSSALDHASAHYSAALDDYDHLTNTPELRRAWLDVSAKWAFVTMYSPDWRQLQILERASTYAKELNDPEMSARTAYWLGWMYYSLGVQANAIACFQTAMQLAGQANNAKLVDQFWLNLGQSHAAVCAYDEALTCLDRGLASKRKQRGRRGTTPAGYAYALGCRAQVCADRGDFARARADMSEALAAVEGSGHAVEGSLLALHAMAELYRGDYAEAIAAGSSARAVADRVRGLYVHAMANAFTGFARYQTERCDDARRQLTDAVELLETRKIGLFLSFVQALAAAACFGADEPERAREYALRALARAELGDPVGQILAYRVLARLALRERALPRAREHVASALELAVQRGSAREQALTQLLAAEVQRAGGEAGADEQLASAREALERLGVDVEAAAAL